jgi:agarase
VATACLGLAWKCAPPGVEPFDATPSGAPDATLRVWMTEVRPLGLDALEYRFEAKLVGRWDALPDRIRIASRTPDTVVLESDLQFHHPIEHHGPLASDREKALVGEHRHPHWHAHFPGFRVRQSTRAPFDPSQLSFVALDRFGGSMAIESVATGRFRIEEIDGRHWLITPDGHGFFSAGLNHVTVTGDYSPPIDRRPYYEAVLAKYGSEEGWGEATRQRLHAWGVNTVGAWSHYEFFDAEFPHTPVLSLSRAAPEVPGWPTGQTGQHLRDYFDPRFEAGLVSRIEGARACAENPWCIGVFSDNEQPWGRSVLQIDTYVDAYLSLPADAPGKQALQAFFEDRYGDVAAFNQAWSLELASFDEIQQLDAIEPDAGFCNEEGRRADRQAFVERVALRYFRGIHDALRGAFPDLLILGPRFLSVYTAPGIIATAAPYLDVVSVNNYDWDEQGRGLFQSEGRPYGYLFLEDAFHDLETVHEISGLPVMVTEWTIRTPTPDVPYLFPPFIPVVDTQAERADRYEATMQEHLSRPYMVGSHWFKFHDQPDTGRGDGENSRFGVVDIDDTPYPELSERMTAVNGTLYDPRPLPAPTVQPAAPIGVPLGQRALRPTQPAPDRTGFQVFILPGVNLAATLTADPLILEAGAPDAAGVAPLHLAQDALLAFGTVTGDVACLRLHASGSHGELACDGGFGHDASTVQGPGPSAAPPVATAFLGTDSGPGSATLQVPLDFTQLPAGSRPSDCETAVYTSSWMAALTTAVAHVEKGATSFQMQGESFACGVDGSAWRGEDGQGMFVLGTPTYDTRVPGGDLAAGFALADRDEACRP